MNVGVASASKRLQKVSEAPANSVVITQEEIRDRGYCNLKDLLRDLPGMETIEYSFSEYGTLVPVRGVIGNNKILVLINGMRVNPPGGEDMIFRNDESIRFAKRVEVVYGPGSTLYGPDAVSAVINIVTIDPSKEKGHGSAFAAGGNHNTFEGGLGVWTPLKEKDSGILAYGQFFDGEGTNYPSSYPDYMAFNQQAFESGNPAAWDSEYSRPNQGTNAFALLQGESTTLQIWHRESKRSSAQAINPIILYSDQARWGDRSDVARIENKIDLAPKVNLKSSLTYNSYETDSDAQYVFLSGGSYFYSDQKYARGRSTALEEQVAWDPLPGLNFIGGVSYTDYESVPKATVPGGFDRDSSLVDQSSQLTYVDAQGLTHTVNQLSELTYETVGAYIQGDWEATDRLRFVAGVRIDHHSRFSEVPVNPRASVIYNVTDDFAVKYIFGKAYVAPPPYFTNLTFYNGTAINIPNYNLSPEKVTSNELNFLYQNKLWSGNVSLYYNQQSNLFSAEDFDPGSPGFLGNVTVDGNQAILSQVANNGEGETYGVDSLWRYYLDGGASVFTALSWVDGSTDVNGQSRRLDRISNWNARLGTTFKLVERLTVTPSFSWRSDPKLRDKSRTGGDAYARSLDPMFKDIYSLDLYVAYRIMDWFEAYADFRNITNNKYVLRGHSNTSTTPSETFSCLFGGRFSF